MMCFRFSAANSGGGRGGTGSDSLLFSRTFGLRLGLASIQARRGNLCTAEINTHDTPNSRPSCSTLTVVYFPTMKICLIQAAAAVVVISSCSFVEGRQLKGDQSMSFFHKKASSMPKVKKEEKMKKEEKKMSVGAKCKYRALQLLEHL